MSTPVHRLSGNARIDVSVVIPAYNAGSYLRKTLDTVASQTGVTFEIHVIDDGSTDDTRDVAESYAPLVHYHHIERFGGPSRPRNIGVASAIGEFIAFFDADDLMIDGKLQAAITALRKAPNAGLLFTDFSGINREGVEIRRSWLEEYTTFREDLRPVEGEKHLLLPAERAYSRLLRANFVGTSSVVCRREPLAQAGTFDESLRNSDDVDMWMRIAWNGWDFLFIDEIYHRYCVTNVGVTGRGCGRYPSMIRSMEKQLPKVRNEADRRCVHGRLRHLWLAHAYGLRLNKQYRESRSGYAKSLAYGHSLAAMIGWTRALLHA